MKKRTWMVSVMAGTISIMLLFGGCTATQQPSENDATEAAAAQSEKELYQAKLAYYQGQLQLLEAQLSEMDAKMLRLQQEYQAETEKMEMELQALRQNPVAGTESGELAEENRTQQVISKEETQASPDVIIEDQPVEEAVTGSTHAYTYEKTEGGVILTKYLGTEHHVEIPAAVDGQKVVSLGDRAFADTAVSSVQIPETVQTLGWFTFYGCSSLQQVSIPASVSSIGYASFDGCHKELLLCVSENSYAQKYAASFALRYELSEK